MLVAIMLFTRCGLVFADDQKSPFKIETIIKFKSHSDQLVLITTKVRNISNEKQKISILGCSDNWQADTQGIELAEGCESTTLITRVLEPNEEYKDEHSFRIKRNIVKSKILNFRLGFKNIKEDSWEQSEKHDNKIPKYLERTWSNSLTINLSEN